MFVAYRRFSSRILLEPHSSRHTTELKRANIKSTRRKIIDITRLPNEYLMIQIKTREKNSCTITTRGSAIKIASKTNQQDDATVHLKKQKNLQLLQMKTATKFCACGNKLTVIFILFCIFSLLKWMNTRGKSRMATIKTTHSSHHTFKAINATHWNFFLPQLEKLRSTQIVLCGEFTYEICDTVNRISWWVYVNEVDCHHHRCARRILCETDDGGVPKRRTLYFICHFCNKDATSRINIWPIIWRDDDMVSFSSSFFSPLDLPQSYTAEY